MFLCYHVIWTISGSSKLIEAEWCLNKLNIIDSDNGLSPDRRQAIIWTNAGTLLTEILGTHVSEMISDNSNIFI